MDSERNILSLTEQKKTLRNMIAKQEKKMDSAYKHYSDLRIMERLFSLPEYRDSFTIMAYYSMASEINTVPILQNVLIAGKTLCLPLCKPHRILEARAVKDLQQTKPGVFDIPEPTDECPVYDTSAIDLIIVPCMSCDRAGNRLGHGGGYYDRFLSNYRGTTLILAREELLSEQIPTGEFDVPCDIVLTEKEIYRR